MGMMIREETSDALQDNYDSSSRCSSSVDQGDITIMGGSKSDKTADKGFQNKGDMVHLFFLWNCLLVLIVGMGVVLSASAHVCLSRIGNMEEVTIEKVSSGVHK